MSKILRWTRQGDGWKGEPEGCETTFFIARRGSKWLLIVNGNEYGTQGPLHTKKAIAERIAELLVAGTSWHDTNNIVRGEMDI